MKTLKRWLVILSVAALGACAFLTHSSNVNLGVVTLEAQSLPITKTLAWDAPTTGTPADSYIVKQDGTQIGTPTGTTQPITITTLGSHTFTIQSVSTLWGAGGTATLTVNVVVPNAPTNSRIQ